MHGVLANESTSGSKLYLAYVFACLHSERKCLPDKVYLVQVLVIDNDRKCGSRLYGERCKESALNVQLKRLIVTQAFLRDSTLNPELVTKEGLA